VTRGRAAFELAAASALVLLRVWTDSSAVLSKPWRTAVTCSAVVVIAWLAVRRPPTLESIGLRPKSWTDGLWPLVSASTFAVLALVGVGAWQGTLLAARDLDRWASSVWHLALLQQFLLHGFLAPRMSALMRDDAARSSLATAAAFAIFHLPNPLLTPLSFAAAFGWREWFRRHPNLPAAWVSHAALGFAVIATQDPDVLRRMRVGAAYLNFRN
jgi:hypothetical protein